jgi:hypothetical protein
MKILAHWVSRMRSNKQLASTRKEYCELWHKLRSIESLCGMTIMPDHWHLLTLADESEVLGIEKQLRHLMKTRRDWEALPDPEFINNNLLHRQRIVSLNAPIIPV